jgi:hypothetical protein
MPPIAILLNRMKYTLQTDEQPILFPQGLSLTTTANGFKFSGVDFTRTCRFIQQIPHAVSREE